MIQKKILKLQGNHILFLYKNINLDLFSVFQELENTFKNNTILNFFFIKKHKNFYAYCHFLRAINLTTFNKFILNDKTPTQVITVSDTLTAIELCMTINEFYFHIKKGGLTCYFGPKMEEVSLFENFDIFMCNKTFQQEYLFSYDINNLIDKVLIETQISTNENFNKHSKLVSSLEIISPVKDILLDNNTNNLDSIKDSIPKNIKEKPILNNDLSLTNSILKKDLLSSKQDLLIFNTKLETVNYLDKLDKINSKTAPISFDLNQFLDKVFKINDKDILVKENLKTFQYWYNTCFEILNDNSLKQYEKQYLLEQTINFFNRKIDLSVIHNLSYNLIELIRLFDFVVKQSHFSMFTPEKLKERLNIYLDLSQNKSTLEKLDLNLKLIDIQKSQLRLAKSEFFKKFSFYLKFLNFDDQSFGLLLIHALSMECREIIKKNWEGYSQIKSDDNTSKKKLREWVQLNTNVFIFSSTDFKMALARSILIKYTTCIKLFFEKDTEKILNFFKPHAAEFDISFISDENLLDQIKTDLILNLEKDFQQLGDLLSLILETASIFTYHAEAPVYVNPNKISSSGYIEIKTNILLLLLEVRLEGSSIPMIASPLDWQLSKKSSKKNKPIIKGGFLSNNLDLTPGIKLHCHTKFDIKNNTNTDVLNYLQNTVYKISPFILTVENNFLFYLQNFLKTDVIDAEASLFYTKEGNKNKIYLKTESEFLEGFELEKQLHFKTNINSTDSNSIEHFKYKKLLENLINKALFSYQSQIATLLRFIQIFLIAKFFSPYLIQFPWFFDYRLRAYVAGSLLSPQGCTFSKSLLDIYSFNDNQTKHDNLNLHSESLIDIQVDSWLKQSLKDSSKSFLYHRYKALNNSLNFLSLDVSSSGLQIYSALTGYEYGLSITNFLITNSESQNSIQDSYLIFYNLFKIELESLTNSIDILLEKEILTLIKNCLDRSIIKNLLIAFLYSEETYSRSNNIKLIGITPEKLFILYPDFEKKFIYNSFSNICFRIAESFEQTFKKLHPIIYKLKKELEILALKSESIKKNKGVHLAISKDSTEIFYKKLKYESHHFKTYNPKTNSYRKYSLLFPTDNFCTITAKTSIAANLIHRLDAEILSDVVLRCKKERIELFTAHDSFYVLQKNVEFVKVFYFQAVENIILNQDVLKVFFTANCEILPSKVEEMLKDFAFNRNGIVKNFKEKNLKMSSFILSPK